MFSLQFVCTKRSHRKSLPCSRDVPGGLQLRSTKTEEQTGFYGGIFVLLQTRLQTVVAAEEERTKGLEPAAFQGWWKAAGGCLASLSSDVRSEQEFQLVKIQSWTLQMFFWAFLEKHLRVSRRWKCGCTEAGDASSSSANDSKWTCDSSDSLSSSPSFLPSFFSSSLWSKTTGVWEVATNEGLPGAG